MAAFHSIVIIVSEDVKESEVAGVDPPTSLNHELLVRLHGVCVSNCIRNVLQVVFSILLAVNTQTQNSIFGQVHVCLLVIPLLVGGIQNHLEVLSLQQVLFEFLAVNESLVSIAGPSTRQHMQETKSTLQ